MDSRDENTLDAADLPPEERARLESAVRSMMELGMGAVYGVEEPGVPEATHTTRATIAP